MVHLLYADITACIPVERQDDALNTLIIAGFPDGETLGDALTLAHWTPLFDADGDIVRIHAANECVSADQAEELTRVLAEFVEPGGWAEYAIQEVFGEEPDVTRLSYHAGTFSTEMGRIIFGDADRRMAQDVALRLRGARHELAGVHFIGSASIAPVLVEEALSITARYLTTG